MRAWNNHTEIIEELRVDLKDYLGITDREEFTDPELVQLIRNTTREFTPDYPKAVRYAHTADGERIVDLSTWNSNLYLVNWLEWPVNNWPRDTVDFRYISDTEFEFSSDDVPANEDSVTAWCSYFWTIEATTSDLPATASRAFLLLAGAVWGESQAAFIIERQTRSEQASADFKAIASRKRNQYKEQLAKLRVIRLKGYGHTIDVDNLTETGQTDQKLYDDGEYQGV